MVISSPLLKDSYLRIEIAYICLLSPKAKKHVSPRHKLELLWVGHLLSLYITTVSLCIVQNSCPLVYLAVKLKIIISVMKHQIE